MKIHPELRYTAPNGQEVCGHQDGNRSCEEKPAWHVLWKMEKGGAYCMLLCPFHMEVAKDNFVYLERHRYQVSCDMPGVRWGGDHCSV